MTDEEWNDLHGFDANGAPKQRFVWEGPGTGAPTREYVRQRAAFCLWYVDKEYDHRTSESEIVCVVKCEHGQWMMTGPVEVDDNDWFREVLEPGTPYADALRQIAVMLALRGDKR